MVELLVVIGIIALLISILLPSLNMARQQAKAVKCLSNIRNMGNSIVMYANENKGFYPMGAWPSLSGVSRTRWVDQLYPYMKNTEIFSCPSLDDNAKVRMNKGFFHTTGPDYNLPSPTPTANPTVLFFGGYGYNYQYLGNGRHSTTATSDPSHKTPFFARSGKIKGPTKTIAIADTDGCPGANQADYLKGEGTYVVDPPKQSYDHGSRSSRRSTTTPRDSGNYGYMTGGSIGEDGTGGKSTYRAQPIERHRGKIAVAFVDGHGEMMRKKDLDDSDGDGEVDNGYWNGLDNVNLR